MHIAGGLYRELCEFPVWDSEFGSGGRAAAAVSALSPGSVLHTYARDSDSVGMASLRALGIQVWAQPSSVGVAFAYFHPLSRPHIEPPAGQIEQQPPLQVSGETVLRFGFLEGDAIVIAGRAIYDPQTSNDPQPFAANGSTANELAIVLNELELRKMAGVDDISVGAMRVIQAQRAAVVVVKGGTRGAVVFDHSGIVTHVPAYRSARVFKIGTGDVFSAMFAYYWGEASRPAFEAADVASRSVAAYCTTRQLPPAFSAAEELQPIGTSPPGPVLLEGAVDTIGRRYVMEEARFRLGELGAHVISPSLGSTADEPTTIPPAAMLVMTDGITAGLRDRVSRAHAAGIPIVVFAEHRFDGMFGEFKNSAFIVTDDLSSALYFAIWAAIPP